MEFFDLFNLVQMFLPSGTINVSVEIQPQIEALVASYRQSMLICLGVAAGIYLICLILGGIGMHVMAKKRGMKGSWMAFVPFLNTLYAGRLAGEVNVFGKKVKWMGIAATLLEFIYVGLSAFSCYLLFSLLQPGYFTYRTANTIGGEVYQAELVTERVPLGMRWMLTADNVCEILIYVFYILMLLAMCLMFYSFYRKYYARSPFIMMFLSALFPFRGIVIFAVRNNAPVDYDAWMRRKMEEFNRRQQQNRPGNYGGYNGQGGGPNDPGGSGGYGGAGGQGGTGENPFPDFGGANGSGDSGSGSDSPFSDF